MCDFQKIQVAVWALTGIIGLVTIYIAWQQKEINKRKLKFDLYSKRLSLYEKASNFVSVMTHKPNWDDVHKFKSDISETIFLFEKDDIFNYLEEIHSHGTEMAKWSFIYQERDRTINPDKNTAEAGKNMEAERIWLASQVQPLRDKFRKEINIFK